MEHVREALRQVVEGSDFQPASEMLKTVKGADAVRVLPFLPYSLATNVAHADIWNRVWLTRLEGAAKVNPFPDFPVVAESEWEGIRGSFLANLDRAYALASTEPFVHGCRTDATAERLLLTIATHTAYHVGQMRLLKRALWLSKRKPGEANDLEG